MRKKLTIAAMAILVGGIVVGGAGPTELVVGGRASANPSIAAEGAFVALAWAAATAEGVTDIYAATSRDAGRTFGSPARVNDVPGDAKVSGEQPPHVSLVPGKGAEPSLAVVWTAKSGSGTRLVFARSDDGGRSFGHSTSVPGGDAAGNRGWEATATDRDGHVLAIWLDHRELTAAGGSSMPMPMPMQHDGQAPMDHGAADSVAKAQLSKLYFGRLDGEGGARAVAAGVCYCCKTALATSANGSVYAVWRHVYPGNMRDIAFTLSRDGGRTFAAPIRVSEDKWMIDGCPENGPTIAVGAGDTVHVVWPTLVSGATPAAEPTLALFYAATRDEQHFSVRQRIRTEGVPRHPQMALGPRGSLLVTWDEQVNGTRRVAAAGGVQNGQGAVAFTRLKIGDAARSEYPTVAAMDNGFTIAWVGGAPTQSAIRIERISGR